MKASIFLSDNDDDEADATDVDCNDEDDNNYDVKDD